MLLRAKHLDLYNCFAIELPFSQSWGETQARNDYFMKRQQNNSEEANEILQYEADQNARLLYNELHPEEALIRPLTPYEHAVEQIEIPKPMPDEPPVAPPRVPIIGTFSYIRGQEPPGMYAPGYVPFAGADAPGGGAEPPTQPPPAAPE